LTLALTFSSQGRPTAQREIAVQAVFALFASAMVHSDKRLASTITMGIFATGWPRPYC
jgi:hypothetical protein